MITYHKVEQGSDEWFDLRKEMLTASNATAIGANGAGLKTYCKQKALDIIGHTKDNYTNEVIERGNILEPTGRLAYELEYSVNVDEIGFITNDKYPNVGISPDGLIKAIGGVELKARNNEKHFSLIIGETKEIPFNQIQMSLLITEREWWDFVSFNPNLSKPLFVKRIYPDLKYFEKLKQGFIDGNNMINEYVEKYNNYSL